MMCGVEGPPLTDCQVSRSIFVIKIALLSGNRTWAQFHRPQLCQQFMGYNNMSVSVVGGGGAGGGGANARLTG